MYPRQKEIECEGLTRTFLYETSLLTLMLYFKNDCDEPINMGDEKLSSLKKTWPLIVFRSCFSVVAWGRVVLWSLSVIAGSRISGGVVFGSRVSGGVVFGRLCGVVFWSLCIVARSGI
ncbi:Uncharacterized protein APZ42_006529 [Daphnia magna]|uniref:Uncharacterized protein n=1 Tax=Daphnia magna TaxID=35525 RepID=A0A164FUQ8_9CRUS|nr:Uncharacterized protein APZ42_006529 [Daphnia magna]